VPTSQGLLLAACNCAGDNVTRIEGGRGGAGNLHSARIINVSRRASLSNSSISPRKKKIRASLVDQQNLYVPFYMAHHAIAAMAFPFFMCWSKTSSSCCTRISQNMYRESFKALSRRNKARMAAGRFVNSAVFYVC
jgi:hypothetical protein